MTPNQEILDAANKYSVLSYFQDLADRGKLKYERRSGNNYYFRDEGNRYAVTETQFFNFMKNEGGGILKAVMHFENKNAHQAIIRIKEVAGLTFKENISPDNKKNKETSGKPPRVYLVTVTNGR
ncbi:hypothetical protein IMZ16_03995 [Cruoricaptor ignavus]|uniref:DUF3991 domain-containing protein n=1 Tax=Cruoricaptor ignavus TaxID=1118202 RepID=A0A7M1T6B2_9FLAO|nr:hypothetical protein [Cruoricaptor ignavus]QOR74604.1 hypothetical protein IMZ16_03995 [Cruoricaptor ignavus]